MALSRALFLVALTAFIFSTTSTADEFTVGDDKGWTVGFDYQTWTANIVFQVGDKLIFKYPVGEHNVIRVNGTDFKNCTIPAGVEPLTSGEDIVVLDSPGRRWYLCGFGNHCENGQKLFINVLPQTQAPSPAPLSSMFPIKVASPSSPWATSPSPSPSPSSWSHNGMTRFGWVPRKLITKFQR